MTTRPQKVTNLRDAENKRINTWIPSNGTGIGLWKGRRVYYVNGKRQSGLTIRNPVGDSVANVTKGLLIDGAKTVYGGVKNTSNALLGMASPWNLAAMGRTKKNITQLGVKPPKKQSKEVLENIARNQAKLMTEGFGTYKETKEVIKKDKEQVKDVIDNSTNEEEVIKATNLSYVVKENQNKVNAGTPTIENVVVNEEPVKSKRRIIGGGAPKGKTRWVGKNTTWVDRWGNVIAPKIDPDADFKIRRNRFELSEAERKNIIMTSLEQEMYD